MALNKINESMIDPNFVQKVTDVADQLETTTAQLADMATKDEFVELSNEVFNIEHGGSTIPTTVESYDAFFSNVPDVNNAYYLEPTNKDAVLKFLNKRIPSLLVEGNVAYPLKGQPIVNGLQLWLDSIYKTNIDINKATYNDLTFNKNGTLTGFSFDQISGWSDGGLVFDGIDDKVRFDTVSLGVDGFTFNVVYFHPTDNPANSLRIISSNSDLIDLYIDTANNLRLKISPKITPTLNQTFVKKGEFNFVSFSYDAITGEVKVIVNGNVAETSSNTAGAFTGVNTLFLGSYSEINQYKGKQKLFYLYNRVLSNSEIQQNIE